ncbi:NADPH-dependent FMN reductase [Deinococcus aestuarii]|uniref:NADPH-dependent FMN reductase n=1 Tax=Deinococcus aestuarii TaxID=2774531 RepID=UPI001C0B1D9A
MTAPFIVGIGGTTRPGSSGEKALRVTLGHAERAGARTQLFGGAELAGLPLYAPEKPERNAAEVALVEAVRQADGLLIATPGYHGGVSGLVKNALDLLEDLRGDERPYLDGRAVGCVVVAAGWQGCGVTLSALRDIVHALRGWPTPLGVTINTVAVQAFAPGGECTDPATDAGLATLAGQVLHFARATVSLRGPTAGVPA